MAKAVEIVKGYYQEWGLKPVGDKGGYIQEFPHPCVEIQPGSTMEILISTAFAIPGEPAKRPSKAGSESCFT